MLPSADRCHKKFLTGTIAARQLVAREVELIFIGADRFAFRSNLESDSVGFLTAAPSSCLEHHKGLLHVVDRTELAGAQSRICQGMGKGGQPPTAHGAHVMIGHLDGNVKNSE